MEKNNKKRLLVLLEILKKNSNEDKHLGMNEIITLIEEKGIEVNNRKTIYDDIKTLNESGYDVEYENGYYLLDAPFSLSEIKIIQDSINSLKILDDRFLNELNNKLYSFISDDEVKLLEKIKYTNKHKDKKLLQRMEDVLLAIKNNTSVIVKRNDLKEEEVYPIFIHRDNDYYYFYYHYLDSNKLYHYRFDNLLDLNITDHKDTITINHKTIIDTINESSNSFYNKKAELVTIILNKNDERLNQRILDDFPLAIRTKYGFSLKVSINNLFFAKIFKYGSDVSIKEKTISDKYIKYLNEVLSTYRHKNG